MCNPPDTVVCQHGAAEVIDRYVWLPLSPLGKGQRAIFHICLKIPPPSSVVDVDPSFSVGYSKELSQHVVLFDVLGQSQLQASLGAELDSPGERVSLLVRHKVLLSRFPDKVIVHS